MSGSPSTSGRHVEARAAAHRRRTRRRPFVAALTALLTLLAVGGVAVPAATAATGDFSLDFVAAAPGSYDHITGGGAYDDRTVGKNADVVESLEGGDFSCGDIVTYFIAVTVDDTAQADADAAQTIELGFQFLMDTTGQSGAAIGDITNVEVNRSPIEDLIAGENTVEDGMRDDGGSVATLVSETPSGAMFEAGSVLNGVVRVTDLERNERVIVRIDTQLYCQAPASPTGNLQADLSTAQLVFIDDTVPATPPTAIPGGAQTIPFKQFNTLQYPQISLAKTVDSAGQACPGVESLQVQAGSTVRYCYVVTNAGTAALYDVVVTDDNTTPSLASDDFTVTLTTGLTDEDEDGFADDLAAGGTASGHADVLVAAGKATGTYTNTATATGDVAFYLGSEQLTDTDTASIVILAAPAIDIQKTPDTQTVVDGQSATFTITVTNTGNVPLTSVTVTDPLAPSCASTIGALAVGAVTSYTCTVVITADMTNVATVTGMYGTTQVTDNDSAAVTVDYLPILSVTKTGTPTSVPETGDDVSFSYTVTNDSVEQVTITSLSDDRFGTLTGDADCQVGTALAAGASCTFEATFAIPAADVPGTHVNTFTASAQDDQGNTDTATDDETITYTDVLPDISVTKTGSPTSVPETGGDVTFTFTVTNDGGEAVTIDSLSDDVYGTLAGDADCQVDTVLDPGDSCSFEAQLAIPAGDYPGSHVNVFTATASDDDDNSDTASDSETITYTDVLPDISVTKTAGVTSVPETGGDVTFSFTVTNNGAESVTITDLDDDKFGGLDGDLDCQLGTTLAAGASCSFDELRAVPAGDFGSAHVNTFTATASDDDGNTDSAFDDATVTYTDVAPTIEVTKTADPTSVPESGGTVTFTFTVQNTSTLESVTILSLVDTVFGPLAGDEDCAVTTVLAAGDSCDFSITQWISGDFSGSDHTNVFTVVAEDDDGTDATDSDDATVGFTDVAPTILVTKTADPTAVPETGGNVTFTFTVTNTGSETVTITSLADSDFGPLAGDDDCAVDTVLAAGESCTFTQTEWIEGNYSGSAHANTFTAVAEDNDGTEATDDDDAMVTFTNVAPSIVVTKTANPISVPETGGNVVFTFTVQNTSSEESVTITSLADDEFGPLTGDLDCMVGTVLAAGDSCAFGFTAWLTGDFSGPDHVNTFTAVAVDDDGTEATDDDDATVDFTDVAPDITITKTADPTSVPETGGDVTFTFVVENLGPETVVLTDLVDDRFGDLDGQGTCDVPETILVGSTYTCSITRFLSSDSLAAHTNVVTATAEDDDGTTDEDTDDETVTFTDVAPEIQITKTADPTSVPETGGNVTFTFLVENIGVEDVTLTTLTDTVFGDLNGQGDCATGGTIPIGGSYSCSITVTLAADDLVDHYNVVTAVGTDDDGTTDQDTDDETVTFEDVAPDIQITKTASPTSVPETGGNVTFTFLVENIGQEDITLTTLTDTVFGDLNGQGDCATGGTIAIGGSYSCSITVTLAADDLTDHYNVATAVGTDDDGTTDQDTDDETVTFTDVLPTILVTKTPVPSSVPETGADVVFTYTVTNTSDESVTITSLVDDVFGTLAGDGDCEVGTVLAPDATCEFSATHWIAGDASGPSHVNEFTATAVDNDGSTATDDDDATVAFDDVLPSILVTKSANPTSVPETGGLVTFTVEVENTGLEAVVVSSLVDDRFGNLTGSCGLPWSLAAGASQTCIFTRTLASDSLTPHTNVVTGTASDNDGNTTTDDDDATVTFTDVAPIIRITKTANPTAVIWTGDDVTYTFLVENIGPEDVTVTSLTDDKFGDLDGQGTCDVPQVLLIGASYSCTITVEISSPDFSSHTNVATVIGEDDEGTQATDTDDATVTFWWYGRTPGYWKTHPEVWTGASWTSYTPSTLVTSVFTVPSCLLKSGKLDLTKPAGSDTLIQALDYKGGTKLAGKAQILLRAATAAVLNEEYYGDGYPPYASTAELIAAVNTTLATCNEGSYVSLATTLDGWNNGNHSMP